MILDNKRAVIFDLDGTLVDSMWMWKDIDIEYLGRYGYELPENLQREIEGMSYTETAVYFKETFQIPDSLGEIKRTWYEMAREKYAREVPLKPGAAEFLERMASQGIAMGIATSNGRGLVDAVSASLGLERYISVISTACDVNKGKPAPDIYLHVAGQLQVKPCDCLVFEDVPMGILAGKNAGMEVCAVEDAASLRQDAQIRELADYYIRDYREILNNTYEVLKHED